MGNADAAPGLRGPGGVRLCPGALSPAEQETLVGEIRAVVAAAPLFVPETRSGRKLSVRMTSAGGLGWVSDRGGYRYDRVHPSGKPWPAIPETVLSLWRRFSGVDAAPDTCLINYYDTGAKMGLHQDRDESSLDWPVVSLSLGDDALFRVGGTTRGGKTESVWLSSGDVVVLDGATRLAFHGIDRVRTGSSDLLSRGGRLNLTLRIAGDTGAGT